MNLLPRESIGLLTASGRKVFPFRDAAEIAPSICIEDIAHCLANQCRWMGATKTFYSVAQHSLLVATVTDLRRGDPNDTLQAHLHDAPEYLLLDLPSPLKHVDGGLDAYHFAHANLAHAIAIATGTPDPGPAVPGALPAMPAWLDVIDKEVGLAERWMLMPRVDENAAPPFDQDRLPDIVWTNLARPMPPLEARATFLTFYRSFKDLSLASEKATAPSLSRTTPP